MSSLFDNDTGLVWVEAAVSMLFPDRKLDKEEIVIIIYIFFLWLAQSPFLIITLLCTHTHQHTVCKTLLLEMHSTYFPKRILCFFFLLSIKVHSNGSHIKTEQTRTNGNAIDFYPKIQRDSDKGKNKVLEFGKVRAIEI